MSFGQTLFKLKARPDLNVTKFTAFHAKYFKNYLAGVYACYVVNNDASSARATQTRQQWEDRPRDSLWWWVHCNADMQPAIIRRHHLRRLRIAFRDALKAKGWDGDGRPLVHTTLPNPPSEPLMGSFSIFAKKELMDTKFADIQEQCSRAIGMLVAEQKKREFSLPLRGAGMMKPGNFGRTSVQSKPPAHKEPRRNKSVWG